ncbi:MarR family winged helix-turn-helix transcriptional regulator [Paenibacillus gansuensis]|uniref:MarR family winged helix-turn-helix transcriptional regulator n=1 Tax=Paenibacillus gansuensis TaxID=306542 RepID=A0ABW5P736_9BACL
MSHHLDSDPAQSLKLFVILSKAYKTLMDQAVRDMKQYGLSPSEFTILEVLYTKGSIPLQQIGDKILITSGTITYNIDKLAAKGLLRRVPCQEDRRVTFAEITEEGNRLFDTIFPQHAGRLHSLMHGLSPEEKDAAMILLKKLGKGAAEG